MVVAERQYTDAEHEIIRQAAGRELCKRSFVDFLLAAKIESDDRDNPGVIPWQPWPYLLERAAAWEAGESEVVLKARQLGFSWLAAAYAVWTAGYHVSAHVALFSAGEREAKELLRKCRYIHANHPFAPPGVFGKVEAEFATGSRIMPFPSTEQTGISYTFRLVVADEAAFHPYGAQNYAAYRPTLSAGGQYICMSTADPSLGPAGFFHDLYWSSKKGETPYRAVFVAWHKREARDAAWLANERAAFVGMSEEFDAYYPESDATAFVARSGLVYGMFREDVHVKAAPCGWADFKWRVAGVDFGGGDPTAIVPLGITGNRHVHQVGEFYKAGPVTVSDIGAYLQSLHRQAPFMLVVCDPSQTVAIAELASLGLPVAPADNRRPEGLGFVASLLEEERLTIDPSCTNSIHEFPGYRWVTRVDPTSKDRYATSTPVDHHADAMDARRYACMQIQQFFRMSGPTVSTIQTRPQLRRAVKRGGFI